MAGPPDPPDVPAGGAGPWGRGDTAGERPGLRHESWTEPLMGSVLSVHVRGDRPSSPGGGALAAAHDELWAGADRAVGRLVAELRRLEELFSVFRPESEVSRYARGELPDRDLSPEVREVFALAAHLERETGGAFAARRPDRRGGWLPDPTGLVKGWAVERAAAAWDAEMAALAGRLLEASAAWSEAPGGRAGSTLEPPPRAPGVVPPALTLDRYVGVGGDLDLRVAHPARPAWRVGVADPARPGELLTTLHVRDAAVATSGTAERGAHLWDPRTGEVADAGLAAVTVVGRSLAWADALATALFVAGEGAVPAWTARGYRALTVRLDGTLTRW